MSRTTNKKTGTATEPSARAVDEILLAGRKGSTAAVMYHSALAAQQGLSATDEKAMDLIERFGPLTAGELSRRSGLAPASVTGLIGRLERIGAARRIAHPGDGRKVLIELDPQFVQKTLPLFDDLTRSLRDLCAEYSDDELDLIAGWLTAAAECQLTAARAFTDPDT